MKDPFFVKTQRRKPSLIEGLVILVIVGIIIVVCIVALDGDNFGNQPYCDGHNKVYPGYDQTRPPTVVPNDPSCMG